METLTYLSFIQNVIGRLSILGVITKLGAITAAAVCLTGSTGSCFLGIFLVLAAWYLDAFFLKLEQAYRNLYNDARKNIEEYTDPGLLSGPYSVSPKKEHFGSIIKTFLSKTFIPYYGTLSVVLLVGMILI